MKEKPENFHKYLFKYSRKSQNFIGKDIYLYVYIQRKGSTKLHLDDILLSLSHSVLPLNCLKCIKVARFVVVVVTLKSHTFFKCIKPLRSLIQMSFCSIEKCIHHISDLTIV